jgi:hypothetical protein
MYLGKAPRIIQAVEQGRGLLDRKDLVVHSFGGSRGAMLVSEGVIDAAIEYTKGFKHLDGMPGLFLAQGAGATVLDLNDGRTGAEMNFGVDARFEAVFNLPEDQWKHALENLRYRFIVACTKELADQIYQVLALPSVRIEPQQSRGTAGAIMKGVRNERT